ncbi:hypothetical protein [Streptomyces sp. NPDC050388]|uniref:hypothetical protein n=1 Tax=Streptomyces sp. NPDC050388 TaxID=3155781 RepID=UPI0034248FA9
MAAEALFSLDTDAHAPGRPERQIPGCARAQEHGIPSGRVAAPAPERLPDRTREHRTPSGVAGG